MPAHAIAITLARATKRRFYMLLRMYVNAKKGLGLRFIRGSGLRLSVYADADYAAASNDQRPVPGVAVMLGGIIGWKSSSKKCVTPATYEAEYIALCDASNEALFTRQRKF